MQETYMPWSRLRRRTMARNQVGIVVLLASCLALGGCGADSAGSGAGADGKAAPPTNTTAGAPPSDSAQAAATVDDAESWIALYLGDSKIGHAHVARRRVEREGRQLVEVTHEHVMNTLRFDDVGQTRTVSRSWETPEGRLVDFSCDSHLGATSMEVAGRVEGQRLIVESRTLDSVQKSELPWDESQGGIAAEERSLLAQPMKPGESRALTSLVVIDRAVQARVELTAAAYEETEMLGGRRKLLRIDAVTTYPGQDVKIDSTIWCDEKGRAIKTRFPFFADKHLVGYAVAREAALDDSVPPDVDIGKLATVRVKRRLDDPHATRKVVYRATLPSGDPSRVFAATAGQAVEKIDEHTAKITVVALRPQAGPAPPAGSAHPDDLAANNLIQSDAPAVAAMAKAVAPSEMDPWKLALALEQHVGEAIEDTTFSLALATAAETARSRRGDCTEHAMLLAALCRARRIPARVAIGLVYFPSGGSGGFAYHMWTEVSIDGQWIPIDATLGRGGIGAAHITLVETNLKDAGLDAFLPVFNVIGQLELEILDVE